MSLDVWEWFRIAKLQKSYETIVLEQVHDEMILLTNYSDLISSQASPHLDTTQINYCSLGELVCSAMRAWYMFLVRSFSSLFSGLNSPKLKCFPQIYLRYWCPTYIMKNLTSKNSKFQQKDLINPLIQEQH